MHFGVHLGQTTFQYIRSTCTQLEQTRVSLPRDITILVLLERSRNVILTRNQEHQVVPLVRQVWSVQYRCNQNLGPAGARLALRVCDEPSVFFRLIAQLEACDSLLRVDEVTDYSALWWPEHFVGPRFHVATSISRVRHTVITDSRICTSCGIGNTGEASSDEWRRENED